MGYRADSSLSNRAGKTSERNCDTPPHSKQMMALTFTTLSPKPPPLPLPLPLSQSLLPQPPIPSTPSGGGRRTINMEEAFSVACGIQRGGAGCSRTVYEWSRRRPVKNASTPLKDVFHLLNISCEECRQEKKSILMVSQCFFVFFLNTLSCVQLVTGKVFQLVPSHPYHLKPPVYQAQGSVKRFEARSIEN